jgi:hypothetical protein
MERMKGWGLVPNGRKDEQWRSEPEQILIEVG